MLLYCTSATRRGSIQCTPFFETPFGKVTVGLVCSIASKRDRSSDQSLHIETGPDAAGVTQLPVRIVVTEQ